MGYSDIARKQKKCHCKRLSLCPMVFSIRSPFLGQKNCRCIHIVTLRGHTHMTSAKFWDFVRKFTQPPLLSFITLSAFGPTPPPPLSADVICVCSLTGVTVNDRACISFLSHFVGESLKLSHSPNAYFPAFNKGKCQAS